MSKRIFIAGHQGMVGSSIARMLKKQQVDEVVVRTREELDLCDQSAVEDFIATGCFDEVYLAAAKVGGIHANKTYPAEFIYQNLVIQSNVIEAAFRAGTKKLMALGSSCIYPKHCEQPMTENSLLTGALEPTNAPYAIAKIAGISLCDSYTRQYGVDFRSLMPCNLYGPGDRYHPENSHVIPALILRFHQAKTSGMSSVSVWGSGLPLREFLFVDDLASACVHFMHIPKTKYYESLPPGVSHINVGSSSEISIRSLALLVSKVVGYEGEIFFDISKDDGTPRKLMDSSLARSMGWSPQTTLESGLDMAYKDFLKRNQNI